MEEPMEFTEIFGRGWQVFWRTRSLWILGILAALFGQSEYNVSANFNQTNTTSRSTPFDPSGDIPNPFEQGPIADFIANPMPYILGFLAISVIFGLIWFLIGTIFSGGLVHGSLQADRDAPIAVGSSLRAALQRFGSLLGINIITAIPNLIVAIIAVAIFIPLFTQMLPVFTDPTSFDPGTGLFGALLGGFACFFILALLSIPFSAAFYFMKILGTRACFIDNSGAIASLKTGWRMLRKNLGRILLVWLVLAVIAVLFGLLAGIPMLALSFGAFSSMEPADIFAFGPTVIGAFAVLFAYSLLVSVVIGGMLTAFNATVWTVLFRDTTAREEPPPAYTPTYTLSSTT
jgi:hypothetical protein